MRRAFIAPDAYVQGAGALDAADEHLDHVDAERAHLLGGETALSVAREPLVAGLEAAGIEVGRVDADVAACTHDTIAEYADRTRGAGADLVVGVGGGVAVDVATAVATRTDAAFVSVPTIASTDAPCSTVSVVYDDEGNFEEVLFRDANPELVLVDTTVIAAAPARFLRHGLGDAFATRFEAEATMRSGGTTATDCPSSYTALEIARTCYDWIGEYGPGALAACRRDAVTPALERTVEANVLLSGLGFESAGTAGAHAVQVGLTNVGVREPHGVLVGFGTIAELVLQDRADILEDALSTYLDLGLDVTLEDLGVADGDLERVGEIARENGMEHEPRGVSATEVADAVRAADEVIHERRA